MNRDLIKYYSDRANEYDRIYLKPERQEDITAASEILKNLFSQKEVFEIACGTGFWTERFAQTASSVFATDINESVIEIARSKEIALPNTHFAVADLYTINQDKTYDTLFGGFIWSHIPKQELDHFFNTIHRFVKKDGTIVLMDNSYVEGSNHPITHTDEYGNTFQTRKLDDGSSHKVLKNFATRSFLEEKLTGLATDLKFIQLNYFWILSYKPLQK